MIQTNPLLIDLLQLVFLRTIGKSLYSYQYELIKKHGEYNIINKSRQLGITTIMACYALLKSIAEDKTVLICSPSLRQSSHVMDEIHGFLSTIKLIKNLLSGLEIVSENQSHIRFKDGGQIYSLPNSPETIRGLKADIVILDEFAQFFNNSDENIMEALIPTLSRGGELWLISTPNGERGMHWQIWSDNTKYSQYNRVLIHYSACPDIKIDKIKQSMDSSSFRQEYENEFIGDMNTFFPYNLLHSCVNNDLKEFDTRDVLCYGIDFGRVHDATFIIGVQKTVSNKSVIKYVKELKCVRFSEQMMEIDTLLSSDSRIECCVDQTGMGIPLFEQLREKYGNRIRGISFNNEVKEQMIVNLKLRFEQQSIEIPNNAQLITQIHSIKRSQTSGQRARYDTDSNEDHHGDAAWALSLALWNMDELRSSLSIF